MTPKDKAKDLITDFYDIKAESPDYGMEWQMAKQCALIAVDEIQDFITKYDNHFQDFKYWDEVTQEIEKL